MVNHSPCQRWTYVRGVLGFLQQLLAVATIGLVLTLGAVPVTFWMFGVTTVCSLTSIYLFRYRRLHEKEATPGGRAVKG
jgi:hypothetical protein